MTRTVRSRLDLCGHLCDTSGNSLEAFRRRQRGLSLTTTRPLPGGRVHLAITKH
jgi:hypothetical protein